MEINYQPLLSCSVEGKKLHGAGFFQNKNEQVGLEGKVNKVNKLQMKNDVKKERERAIIERNG